MKQVIDRTTIFLYGFLIITGMIIITAFILFFSCTKDVAGSDVGNEVAISLTGKVLNKNSEGVPGVIAKLARLGFYDVTNYQGQYSIQANKDTLDQLGIDLDTVADSVIFIKDNSQVTSLTVLDWTDTLPPIYLVQRDFSGKLVTTDTSFKRIEAVLYNLSDMTVKPKSTDLFFTPETFRYSGFVYFTKQGSSTVNYSVYVNVYNKDSVFTGRSPTLKFNSTAGDIVMPDFNPYNATPVVIAGNDTALSIHDTLLLHATAIDSFSRQIIKWEWNINGSGFVEATNGDTVIVLPADSNPDFTCVARATDNDGNSRMDSIIIAVCKDVPIADAIISCDTIVSINDPVKLSGSAYNKFGTIVKWEWSCNGSNFIQTSKGDTTIFAPSVAPSDSAFDYKCILKITDDDGNVAMDTSNTITIWKDVPVAYAGQDTTVYMNSQFALHGEAHQKCGNITKWEWNVNNSGFKQTSGSDTAITTPSEYTQRYPCILRVTDDDGNISNTDTLVLEIGKWEIVGDSTFPDPGASFQSLCVWNDTPFISYMNLQNNYKANVVKYNGAQWEAVGDKDFSDEQATKQNLCIWNGTPYIAYSDGGNGSKTTVMKYTGVQWEPVGKKGFSDSAANNISFSISSGGPYIAYSGGWKGAKLNVMKFNGTQWTQVGKKGISNGYVYSVSLCLWNSIPYVAYTDSTDSIGSIVINFSDSQWKPVGIKGFSDGYAGSQSLFISNGTPYIAYSDKANASRTTVMKFNGLQWEPVGNKGFSDENAYHQSLFIYNGIPYVAFYNEKVTVMSFNGSNWQLVGKGGFPGSNVDNLSLYICNGTIYVGYGIWDYMPRVMKLK